MIVRRHEADGIRSTAVFSVCERYRYSLTRLWAESAPLAFLLMNPSTATELVNDPTIERCQRRALSGGYGGVAIYNAFAWRETDSLKLPGLIAAGVDIVGPGNDGAILDGCRQAQAVVCGWGRPGRLQGRDAAVLKLLRDAGITPHALAVNGDGTPRHPLYIGYAATLIPLN